MERERQERLQKAREAAKAREENTRTSQTDAGNTSPGAGDFFKFLKDPELIQAFEVSCEKKNHSLFNKLTISVMLFFFWKI